MGIEFRILDFIQTLRNPALDVIMKFVSALGTVGAFWIVIAIILLIIKKTRKTGLAVGFSLLFDVLAVNVVLKHVFARIRPCDVNTAIQLIVPHPSEFSFPSGHAAAAFSFSFGLLFAGHKKTGIAAVILSCIISFSRLYLYVHYPTDVLGGALVGLICGFFGALVAKKIFKKIEEKRA